MYKQTFKFLFLDVLKFKYKLRSKDNSTIITFRHIFLHSKLQMIHLLMKHLLNFMLLSAHNYVLYLSVIMPIKFLLSSETRNRG